MNIDRIHHVYYTLSILFTCSPLNFFNGGLPLSKAIIRNEINILVVLDSCVI